MKSVFLLLFVFINLLFGFDSVEILNPHIIVHQSGYFKTNKNITPESALKQQFIPLSKKAVSFGFDHDTYWFLFEVSTTSNEQFFLDSKDILGNYQDLYVYHNGKFLRHDKNGFYLPLEDKMIKTFSSRFTLETHSSNTLYLLKINNPYVRLISFAFGSEKEIEKSWNTLLMILVSTTAIALSFFIYNLLLFIFTKDKSFLYYFVYMLGFLTVNQLSLGYLPFIIGIDGKTTMTFWIYAMITYTFGLTFFTIHFLNLHDKHKRLKNIFIILLIINNILTPFHIFTGIIPYSQSLWLLSIQIFQFFAIFIGIKRYREGFKPALYYLIATGGGIAFSFGFVILTKNSGVYYSLTTLNLPNIALLWDLIFFSLALAYRIKLLKEENAKNEQLAIMKSRQKVIGELTGNIAHQWRQPLNSLGAIIANVEGKIKYSHLSDEELIESCRLSTSVLQHLSGTIDTLQDFFVDQTDEKENFDLNDHLVSLIHFLKDSMAHQNITINFTPQNTLFIHSNKNLFSQVIMNILLNAKDILIENNQEKKKIITLSTTITDSEVIITIEDNGGGIKIDPIEKIFELFISGKTGGLGIGLYMSKNIVEKLGGEISAFNTKNGANFTIVLPM